MITFIEFLMEQKSLPGTYAAVRPCSSDKDALNKIMKVAKVPNLEENLHTTLLYSRKNLPNYAPNATLEFKAQPMKYEIWPTESGKNCLVLTMSSPELQSRHKLLMKQHGAEYDYPEYKVHISLSYDVGDFDFSILDINDLPEYMILTGEYQEDLDLIGK